MAERKGFSTDNLGEYIKREREKKGITLEEAARTTRIRKVYLQAIEDGDFNIQPSIFMKGFIKSYS
ncbi:MAG: helix-turn-helix domain-containing protein, partial [Deltaproteobacteria bacterium]